MCLLLRLIMDAPLHYQQGERPDNVDQKLFLRLRFRVKVCTGWLIWLPSVHTHFYAFLSTKELCSWDY